MSFNSRVSSPNVHHSNQHYERSREIAKMGAGGHNDRRPSNDVALALRIIKHISGERLGARILKFILCCACDNETRKRRKSCHRKYTHITAPCAVARRAFAIRNKPACRAGKHGTSLWAMGNRGGEERKLSSWYCGGAKACRKPSKRVIVNE